MRGRWALLVLGGLVACGSGLSKPWDSFDASMGGGWVASQTETELVVMYDGCKLTDDAERWRTNIERQGWAKESGGVSGGAYDLTYARGRADFLTFRAAFMGYPKGRCKVTLSLDRARDRRAISGRPG